MLSRASCPTNYFRRQQLQYFQHPERILILEREGIVVNQRILWKKTRLFVIHMINSETFIGEV